MAFFLPLLRFCAPCPRSGPVIRAAGRGGCRGSCGPGDRRHLGSDPDWMEWARELRRGVERIEECTLPSRRGCSGVGRFAFFGSALDVY